MKAYLIPGNGEDLKSRDYQAVLDIYKELGYEPHFVPIKWNYKTIDDWVDQVNQQLSKKDIENSLLSGFSFGSMIALAIAAQVNPNKLLLFSLSPYFKEDMPLKPSWEKWAGKRKTANFKRFSMDKLATRVSCPTQVFIGSKEVSRYPNMNMRAKEAAKRIPGSKLVIVGGVGHDVGDPKYVASIMKELK